MTNDQNLDPSYEPSSSENRPSRARQRITPLSLLEAKRLQDPQIHPDGQRVAFVATEADFDESRWVSHLWLTELPAEGKKEAGGLDSERQLTFSRDGESHPRWSWEGHFLAFLSARPDETEPLPDDDDDDEPAEQVWALPIDGGEARKLTSAKEGVLDFAWIPETEALIFLAPEPRPRPVESVRKEQRNRRKNDPIVEQDDRRRRQFWRVDVEERKPKLLFTADYGVTEFAVSPDGERLCYVTNRSGDPNDYHVADLILLDIETEVAQLLTDRPGGKYEPRWSPNGTQLAFLSWLDPELSYSRSSLFVVDVPPRDRTMEGSEGAEVGGTAPQSSERINVPTGSFAATTPARLLTEPGFDYDIETFGWSSGETSERAIYALANVRTGSEILHIDSETGIVTRLELEADEERRDLGLDPDGRGLVWVAESASALPEIVLRDEEGILHTLTRLNADFGDTYLLPRQEVVCWHSADGLEIEGVLTYPNGSVDDVRYPLIVQIHGGPKGRVTSTLRDYAMHPVWAAEGYVVLRPNFRGSEGYGNAFAIANRRDLGGGDYEDILAGVDWCVAQGIADPDRLGVMGGSYGGYMTNWIIGHTDRFKAAVSMFGIFHLQTDYSNSVLSRWDNDYLGAYYWEDPEIYRRLSPGSYIEQIATPTLILHGDEDDNTFISNSKELYQALRHRGITTQFVHYPREGHGLREPNHKLDEIRRCLAWMDRYVRGAGQAPVVYRSGDTVPAADGQWELCVTKAELAQFAGQPEESGPDPTALLEVGFTVYTKEGVRRTEPYNLSVNAIALEPSASTAPEAATVVAGALRPLGIPLDIHGVRTLVEGDNLRLTLYPDPETAQIAFAFAVVFRVPKSGGDATLKVADFPQVRIAWTAEEEDESEENDDAEVEEEK